MQSTKQYISSLKKMFPKGRENAQLKKEIQFNEAVEQKLKTESFDAAFKKPSHESELLEPSIIVPVVTAGQHNRERPWIKLDTWRNWVVLAGAVVLAVVLLVVLLMEKPNRRSVEDEWSALQSAAFGSHGAHDYSKSESRIEALVQETTTTTTTTEAPLRQELDYITASVIVNNATVPRMDTTFSGIFNQIARADAFVVLYVIDGKGNHRRVGQTSADKNTLSPKWNYLFEHDMQLTYNSILDFELWDWDAVGKDERFGKIYVKVAELIDNELNGVMIRKEYGNGYNFWFTVHWRPHYRYV